jgi:hypothetical protein
MITKAAMLYRFVVDVMPCFKGVMTGCAFVVAGGHDSSTKVIAPAPITNPMRAL